MYKKSFFSKEKPKQDPLLGRSLASSIAPIALGAASGPLRAILLGIPLGMYGGYGNEGSAGGALAAGLGAPLAAKYSGKGVKKLTKSRTLALLAELGILGGAAYKGKELFRPGSDIYPAFNKLMRNLKDKVID